MYDMILYANRIYILYILRYDNNNNIWDLYEV